MIFLNTRPEVKVTVTCEWYKTLHHPKMHSHTKFGIPISNSKKDMLLTQLLLKLGQRSRSQWPVNGIRHSTIPRCIHTPNLGFPSQIIWDMLLTQLLLKLGQRSRSQWPENNMWDSTIPRCVYTPTYAPNTKLLKTRGPEGPEALTWSP